MSVRAACEAFGVSETCYRYRAKRCPENGVIAEWPVKLTRNQRNWGFGLCFLHLGNVKGLPGITNAFIASISESGNRMARQAAEDP
ncbi:integrase [Pandoraea horticolens]|uniref:Integrase n=1 Tax=Pandoraea horticolens TaxID=2508298 RepID=A0A5E4XRB6_9BURK|nr:integrase [Pandoraea horticolens]